MYVIELVIAGFPSFIYSVGTIVMISESNCKYWKERLKQIISFNDSKSTDNFIMTTIRQAFAELQEKFSSNGIEAKINSFEKPLRIEIEDSQTYFPQSYFGDAREGYDVRLFTKNELISDVLKHYDRFIEIISEEGNEMFISSNANRRLR